MQYCNEEHTFEVNSISNELLLKLCKDNIISRSYLTKKLLTFAATTRLASFFGWFCGLKADSEEIYAAEKIKVYTGFAYTNMHLFHMWLEFKLYVVEFKTSKLKLELYQCDKQIKEH